MKQKICDLQDLSEHSCAEFSYQQGRQQKDGFLVFYKNRCFAYENSCPHTGVNLNWQPEQFFSHDGEFLQCSLHGALFEADTGSCIHGPCLGQKLNSIDIEVLDGVVYMVK